LSRRGLILGAAAIGGLGAIATAAGFAIAPTQAAFSYLTAWTFALSIAVGALIFLMMGHAIEARWTIVFQRFTEAIVGSLPVLALLFIPLAVSADRLYPWIAPAPPLDAEVLVRLAHKAPYLNFAFWVIRAAAFLALWIAIGELLVRWSARAAQVPHAIDPTGEDPRSAGKAVGVPTPRDRASPIVKARALSAAGFPAVGLTLTFAAFDWLMSLTPAWYSTIFGLLYFSGGFVAALSLIAVIARGARRVPIVAASVHPSHTGALGRMMFAFLVFWAYMEFAQGLIIWIANKPDEVPWYIARGAASWDGVFAVLVIGHFALPFFALLSKPLKRRPTLLAIAGAWLVAMHYVDVYWIVMPVLHARLAIHWLDLAAPCAVLGIATAATMARGRTRLAIASDHPQFAAAVTYEGT
jgi:hypothetical protein